MIDIKFRKIGAYPDAHVPTQAVKGDAGYDLYAAAVWPAVGFIEYETGIAIELPAGYAGFIFPRSSIFKTGLVLVNSVGVIDAGYRGEIKVLFYKVNNEGLIYKTGDRIAQLIVMPVEDINFVLSDVLSDSDRAGGGFGHTGT